VTEGWQFVLNESSVGFLLNCRLRQREALLKILQELLENPCQPGDYEARDSTGRPVQIKLAGGCFITYWLDNYVKELRVIKIERV
jgi:hypothetical protein